MEGWAKITVRFEDFTHPTELQRSRANIGRAIFVAERPHDGSRGFQPTVEEHEQQERRLNLWQQQQQR